MWAYLPLLWILSPYSAFSETISDSQGVTLIESISGGDQVTVIRRKTPKLVSAGEEVESGDKIKTDEGISAVLRYKDGSEVTISPESQFTVEEMNEDTQWNKLQNGTVRAVIAKPSGLTTSKKPRFVIRTRSAVLGVRGTEFVMSWNAMNEVAEIHTLEGTVEVARSEVGLMSGKGALVNEGQFIQGSPGGLSTPASFNKEEFLNSFESGGGSSMSSSAAATSGSGLATQSARAAASQPAGSASSLTSASSSLPAGHPQAERSAEMSARDGNKAAEASGEKNNERWIKPFAFQFGVFFTQIPPNTVRAFTAAWTPTIILPFMRALSLRGHIGANFAQQASLAEQFWVTEYQIYLSLNVLNFAFIEGGIGEQIWKSKQGWDGPLQSINVGLLPHFGILDRIFVGIHLLNVGYQIPQYKAGIGISF